MKHIRGISGMALAIAIATPAVAQARPAETTVLRQEQRFDIAPSDLRTAISRFSQATGVQVVVAPDAVSGRRTACEIKPVHFGCDAVLKLVHVSLRSRRPDYGTPGV